MHEGSGVGKAGWRGNVTGIKDPCHMTGGGEGHSRDKGGRRYRSMDKTELTAADIRCDILVLQQVAEDVSEQAVASPDVHGLA